MTRCQNRKDSKHLLRSLASFPSTPSLVNSCLLTALAGLGGNLDPGKLSREAARRREEATGNCSRDRVMAPPRTTPCLLLLLLPPPSPPLWLERPWPSSSCFSFASASLFEKVTFFCHTTRICFYCNLYKESEASEARMSEAARSILTPGGTFTRYS